MRRTVIPALTLLVLGGAAACANVPGTPSATATPTATPAPTCPVGSWRSTGVTSSTAVAGTPVTLQGGADVTTAIAADGAVTADFSSMKPVTYTATVAGSQVSGELLYQGPLTGKVSLGAATTSSPPSSASSAASTASTASTATSSTSSSAAPSVSGASGPSGAWQPVGQVNWADLKITVKLTKPVAVTVVDNVKLSDVTNNQTVQAGNVVDLQPLLRVGTYRCDGNDTLVITPSATGGPTVAWTFVRV